MPEAMSMPPVPLTSATERSWTPYEVGIAAWPKLAVASHAFEHYLRERGIEPDELRPELIADLFLGCACLAGVPGGTEAFASAYEHIVECAARPYDPSKAFAQEVRQRLHEQLFVGGPSRPRIAQFSGRGPLGSWVMTAARRIALRLARQNSLRAFSAEDAFANEISKYDNSELGLIKARYKGLFNDAIVIALRQLAPRDRVILRMHVVDGLSMAQIATMHRVSQPTISRWMRDGRADILRTVREIVRDALDVEDTELDSLVDMLQSQFEISFSQL